MPDVKIHGLRYNKFISFYRLSELLHKGTIMLARSKVLAGLTLIALAGWGLIAAEKNDRVTRTKAAVEERMRRDITFLASDQREGRGVSTKGINLAADYIAAE